MKTAAVAPECVVARGMKRLRPGQFLWITSESAAGNALRFFVGERLAGNVVRLGVSHAKEAMVMPDVFVRVRLSATGEADIFIGRWFDLPIVPRVGDQIHYGDNWPADNVKVHLVELWVWEPYDGVIICECEETQLEELSDSDVLGTICFRDRAAEFGFKQLEDEGDWFAGD